MKVRDPLNLIETDGCYLVATREAIDSTNIRRRLAASQLQVIQTRKRDRFIFSLPMHGHPRSSHSRTMAAIFGRNSGKSTLTTRQTISRSMPK